MAAVAIVILAFGLALAIAMAQERLVEAMRAAAPRVKRLGGRLLILVGGWLVLLGVLAGYFARVFAV